MELLQEITNIVSALGFPIAVTIYCLYQLNQNDIRNDKEKEELCKYIKENTEVLQKLCDRVGENR